MLMNQSTNTTTTNHYYTINIMDGQNASLNPCFPISFNITYNIIINFNTTNIGQFNDWYPSECSKYNYILVNISSNKYLFKGGQSLTFNNLIIDNPFDVAIIHSNEVQCNNCKFVNIYLNHQHIINATLSFFVLYSQFLITVNEYKNMYT